MLVIVDALLLLVLAGAASPPVQGAYEAGEIFTTGTWYYRLANALGIRRVEGALKAAFRALGPAEQHLVQARLQALPREHRPARLPEAGADHDRLGLAAPRQPVGGRRHRNGDRRRWSDSVRTDAPLIRVNALAVGIDFEIM